MAQDSCTERISAASDQETKDVVRSDTSLQRLKFCSSSFEEYRKSKDGDASGFYSGAYGSGSYNENEYNSKKTQSCSDLSIDTAKNEFSKHIKSSIDIEKLRALCPGQRFYCSFDQSQLKLTIHNNEPNRTIRAYFSGMPIESGSLRLIDKKRVRDGKELLRTDPTQAGFIVPLALINGQKSQAGRVTLNVVFGPNFRSIGQEESCDAVKAEDEARRQLIDSPGSAMMNTALPVQPTFSRIRNLPDNREYEWFKFTAPANGKLQAKLYAKDFSLILRLHVAPHNIPAFGNRTIVEAGNSKVVSLDIKSNKTYIIGIQANSGGATGAQLDVSFARK